MIQPSLLFNSKQSRPSVFILCSMFGVRWRVDVRLLVDVPQTISRRDIVIYYIILCPTFSIRSSTPFPRVTGEGSKDEVWLMLLGCVWQRSHHVPIRLGLSQHPHWHGTGLPQRPRLSLRPPARTHFTVSGLRQRSECQLLGTAQSLPHSQCNLNTLSLKALSLR